jgi:DNA-binding CsgD family transcriptional regulator
LDLGHGGEEGPRLVGFVGRQTELAALRVEAEAARAGVTRLVSVTGEPGVGKTTLATRFAERLTLEGFQAVRTACASITGAPDLLPWHRALSDLARPDLSAMDGDHFTQVTAIAEALTEAARARPLLVVIDDLQRAGPATLAPLEYLAELAPAVPLLLLGLVREPPGIAISARRASTQLMLRGLSAEEAGELVAEVAARPLPARVVAELARRCDGNPSLLRDLVRRLDGTRLRSSGVERLVLDWPRDVKAAAQVALAPLDRSTREVLETASVIGREFDLAILDRMLAGGPDPIRAVDLALAHGVLTARSSQIFAFSQALVREVLYDSLGLARRTALHESVAAALAEFRRHVGERGPTVGEFAHHLIAATALGGDDRLDLAITYATAAGTAATADGRHHDACAYHETALELAVRAGWQAAPLGRLTVALGRAYLTAGSAANGQVALSAAARTARQIDDAGLLAESALGYGPRATTGLTAPNTELVTLLREARAADLTPEHAVRVNARLAVELASAPGQAEVEALLADAEARLARAETPPATGAPGAGPVTSTRPQAELRLAYALAAPRPDRADAALRAAVELGDPLLECQALAVAGATAIADGDLAVGGAALQRAVRMAATTRHPLVRWWGACATATLATIAGHLDEAEDALVAAREAGRTLPDDTGDLGYAAQLAAVRVAQGRGVELAPLLAELNRGSAPIPDWLSALSARVAFDQGRRSMAAAIVDAACLPVDPWAAALLGEVALELGEHDAITRLDAQLAGWPTRGWMVLGLGTVCAGPVALLRARFRLALDDRDGAAALLDVAQLAAADTLWQPAAELAQAEWLAHADAEGALAAAVSAAEQAGRLGLTPVVAGARRLVKRPAGPAEARSGLTRREREVFDLALAGESARDIAERLFISERTAESHLANIYRKLNVRSRVELLTRILD